MVITIVCGFNDIFLGKLSIPKADQEFDEVSDIEKIMSKIIELDEIAYTELILSVDVKNSNGKIFFKIVKECKIISIIFLGEIQEQVSTCHCPFNV